MRQVEIFVLAPNNNFSQLIEISPNYWYFSPVNSARLTVQSMWVMLLGPERARTHANFTSIAWHCVRGHSPNRHLEYAQRSQTVLHEKWRSIRSAVFSIALCIFHVFTFHLTIELLHCTDNKFGKKFTKLLCLIATILCCMSVVQNEVWIQLFYFDFLPRSNDNKWMKVELV